MSFLVNSPGQEIREFKGATFRDEETDRDPRYGLLARNVEFPPGGVGTRRGFVNVFDTGRIWSMFFFPHPNGTAYLLYVVLNPSPLRYDLMVRNLESGVSTLLWASYDAVKLQCAIHGSRVYIAGVNSNGNGIYPLVWDGDPAHTPTYCFPLPLQVGTNYTYSSADNMTVTGVDGGTYRWLVSFRTQEGYWTIPSPYAGNAVQGFFEFPLVHNATGAFSFTLTVTPNTTWPSWVDSIQFFISVPDNPNAFYVVPRPLPTGLGGTSTPVTVTITEASLEIRGWEPADKYFGQIVYVNGGSVWGAKAAINWGNRVVWVVNNFGGGVSDGYVGQDCFIPSDPDEPQRITASRHLKNLSGNRVITSMEVLGGALIGFSEDWVESWADNGDYPVTFSNPEEISNSMGAPGWGCTQGNKDQPYLLVMNQQGLWRLEGSKFSSQPLTWGLDGLWQSISWGLPEIGICVEHDVIRKHIWVAYTAKVGGQGMMFLSYAHGRGLKELDYAEVTFPDTLFRVSDMRMVSNPLTNVREMWFCGDYGESNGRVARQKSLEAGDSISTLYTDTGGTRIDSVYEISPLPSGFVMDMMDFVGFILRVKGSGSLLFTAWAFDHVRSQTNPAHAITLSTAPGKFAYRLLNLQSEKCSLSFTNSSEAGSWFSLSHLKLCFRRLTGLR
jgi:hypothetical protein